jgi:hypothetical protein
MKLNFLYQTAAASRTPDKGLPPPDPRSLRPLSSTEFVERAPLRKKNSWVRHRWAPQTGKEFGDPDRLINWRPLKPTFFNLFRPTEVWGDF